MSDLHAALDQILKAVKEDRAEQIDQKYWDVLGSAVYRQWKDAPLPCVRQAIKSYREAQDAAQEVQKEKG